MITADNSQRREPVVTVIIPCHNEQHSILRTLQAVLAQRADDGAPISDWGEVIAIDDEAEKRLGFRPLELLRRLLSREH